MLRFHVTVADFDGVQFVLADATQEEFLTARRGVEGPLSIRLHDRHGERPVLFADGQERNARSNYSRDLWTPSSSCGPAQQRSRSLLVADRFAGEDDVMPFRSENLL